MDSYENLHILKRNSNNAHFSVIPLEGSRLFYKTLVLVLCNIISCIMYYFIMRSIPG